MYTNNKQENEIKKECAIIYVRSSSKKEISTVNNIKSAIYKKNYFENIIGIAEQEKICRDYCIKNNIEVLGVYSDNNTSGTNLKRRGLRDAMLFCQKHKGNIDSVVVTNIDRISHSARLFIRLMRSLFRNGGVEIISVKGGDSDSERFSEGQLLPLN